MRIIKVIFYHRFILFIIVHGKPLQPNIFLLIVSILNIVHIEIWWSLYLDRIQKNLEFTNGRQDFSLVMLSNHVITDNYPISILIIIIWCSERKRQTDIKLHKNISSPLYHELQRQMNSVVLIIKSKKLLTFVDVRNACCQFVQLVLKFTLTSTEWAKQVQSFKSSCHLI